MERNTDRTLWVIALIALISMSCMVFKAGRDTTDQADNSSETVQEEPDSIVDEPEGETLRKWAISAKGLNKKIVRSVKIWPDYFF